MLKITTVESSDVSAICQIYNHYIDHTVVTFEEEPVSKVAMLARIEQTQLQSLPWLIAHHQDEVIGYAYGTPWRSRSAYRYSVEVSVYLSEAFHGRGIGSLLYESLFAELKKIGITTAIAGITLPNEKSIALHEKMGMHKVAHFKKVGLKFDRWLDVGYWQVSW